MREQRSQPYSIQGLNHTYRDLWSPVNPFPAGCPSYAHHALDVDMRSLRLFLVAAFGAAPGTLPCEALPLCLLAGTPDDEPPSPAASPAQRAACRKRERPELAQGWEAVEKSFDVPCLHCGTMFAFDAEREQCPHCGKLWYRRTTPTGRDYIKRSGLEHKR